MIGLLWFDDTDKDLREKVAAAARRYGEKFGHQPTVCYVHPSMLNGLSGSDNVLSLEIGGVRLRVMSRRSVLRHHFWIGQEDG